MENNPDPEQMPLVSRSIRPVDFTRLLLAARGGPPRARARDQQADLAGEAIRLEILGRIALMDPDPEDLEQCLASIAFDLGEPSGPARGVCTSILQEWVMASINPGYWKFLVEQAVGRAEGSRTGRARSDGPC